MCVLTATTRMRRRSITIVNMCVMCALHSVRRTLVEVKSAVSVNVYVNQTIALISIKKKTLYTVSYHPDSVKYCDVCGKIYTTGKNTRRYRKI